MLRAVLAIGGGYGVAALAGPALTWWLPWSRAENATAGMLAGLLAWPAVVMLCFALRTARHACIAMAGSTGLLAALALMGGWRP